MILASGGHQQGPVVVTIKLKVFWEFFSLNLRVWEAKKRLVKQKKYTKERPLVCVQKSLEAHGQGREELTEHQV